MMRVVATYLGMMLCLIHYGSSKSNRGKIVELYGQNVTNNLMDWETDMAIMLYAPWCTYCKQLNPSWELIAEETASNSNLIIGKLNCESPAENIELCRDFEIDRYPTVYFVGFGDFHQSPKKNKKMKYPNLVHFRASLYPEAVFDWIRMLSFLSTLHRGWDRVMSIFTGNTRYEKKIHSLQDRLLLAERKVRVFGKELEKYKAIEVFDALEDEGDPFPLLHQLKPDEKNLPFRYCIIDMAQEYCKYFPLERYCQSLNHCVQEELEPEACRPAKCPFEDHRGCVVVSACLKVSVIEQYKTALASD